MTTLDTYSYIDWSAKILNEHLKTELKWLGLVVESTDTLGQVKW